MFYSEDDFIYTVQSDNVNDSSKFDNRLRSEWNNAAENGYFRYRLNITQSRTVPGKYSFFNQLNTDRHTNRRDAQQISCITQPFDPTKFNFTKIRKEEILFEIGNKSVPASSGHFIVINVSPLEYGHCLLVPALSSCLPQVVTLESIRLLVEILLLSGSPALRVGFNGLQALASVNHLHYHLYYLQHCMLLEHIRVEHLSGPCYQLVDYPAPGFVFQLPENKSVLDLARSVYCLTNYLQNSNIPHNLFITRGTQLNASDEDTSYSTVRVYIWARKPSAVVKEFGVLNVALCELFGHFVIKTETEYLSLTEEKVCAVLSDTCKESFESVQENVKKLFET